MDIKSLRYFVAVAEELSFRLAAERLFISQPPLSRQIKKLEEELDTILFNRGNNRVQLTYSGNLFYPKAKEIINTIEETKNSFNATGKEIEGILRVNFTFFGISSNSKEWIEIFKSRFPKVKLIINETSGSYYIKEKMLNKEVDLAFTYSMSNDSRVESIVTEYDYAVYVIPENNTFAKYKSIKIKELKDEDLILFPRHSDPFWYDVFLRKCFDEGFTPKIVQHTESIWNKINLVSLGTGITVTGNNFSLYYNNGVAYVPTCDSEKTILPVILSYRKDNDNPFIDHFLKIVSEHPAKKNRLP